MDYVIGGDVPPGGYVITSDICLTGEDYRFYVQQKELKQHEPIHLLDFILG